ncbi:MAG: cytochrome c oxidase accessory protein CcoG [Gammaproteobacteria bacterium]|nr:cytochrome c oxidase accessory protein CcoG [Gammaproteobacteria bacterium]MCP5299260.1 cytochrome c oxidase accessory protein CcoG [Chromatiaceae bacterium]
MSQSAAKQTDPNLESELYKKREKLYPREVHGVFAVLRLLTMAALLGAYYGMPWINWDGHQAVLFDLPARKFYIFGLTLWPQDFFYLSMLLIIAAISLFLFTALAGRLWCGYACPQTVWTEIYMWIERKIEGSSKAQRKRDQGPRDAAYFGIKSLKHAAWLLFSLWTGFTFVGYFTPILELWTNVITWTLGPWETFWIFFYGFATYGNAGFMREQVCIYMCPYARFQSAMFDHDTLIISYDEKRGNPRGSRKRGTPSAEVGLGDCIDCSLCVQVCPVGIDIRDGLQYQCIGCAACIDVCDDVMDKMGYPRGLVKYTTENALMGNPTRIVRPRVLAYVAILAFVSIALLYALLTRVPLEVDIIRDRNALYTETDQGLVQNVYNLKIINMDDRPQRFRLAVSGLEGLKVIGQTEGIEIGSGAVIDLPLRVEIDPIELKSSSTEILFHIESEINPQELSIDEHARFLGPVSR